MTKRLPHKSLSRRDFVRMAGGAMGAAAGMGLVPSPFRKLLQPVGLAEAQSFPRARSVLRRHRWLDQSARESGRYFRPRWAG